VADPPADKPEPAPAVCAAYISENDVSAIAALLLFHAKASDRYVVAAQRLFGVPFQNLRLTYRVNERDDIEDYFDVAFRK
jgi:hypothetical protein